MNRKGFLITILIVSLVGAIVLPLIGVWFPQIREVCDWSGYTVIAIMAIAVLKEKAK